MKAAKKSELDALDWEESFRRFDMEELAAKLDEPGPKACRAAAAKAYRRRCHGVMFDWIELSDDALSHAVERGGRVGFQIARSSICSMVRERGSVKVKRKKKHERITERARDYTQKMLADRLRRSLRPADPTEELARAVAKLSLADQRLVWAFADGWSAKRIAASEGWSVASAEKRRAEAVATLLRFMN